MRLRITWTRLAAVFSVTVLAWWTAAFASSSTDNAAGAARPNILLMIAEDMSWKDWGVYGNGFVNTPNIDRVAKQGVRFTNAYCNSPVCHPSRSTLLTGQDIWRLRDAAVFGGTLHSTIPTYPSMLRDAGYEVAFSGKGWGPGHQKPGGWTIPPTGRKGEVAEIVATAKKGKQPFCFWLGSRQGHREFEYQPDGRALDAIELPPYVPDTAEVRKDYAGYYQEIEDFDAEVGKVLALLEESGQADNTILILTADHGQPWPRGKGSLYDLGTRVPLIVHWPDRIKPGWVVDDFINLTDLAPTFLEASGLNVPEEMTGKSLMPILESEKNGRIEKMRNRTHFGLEAHHSEGPFGRWLGYMSGRAIRTETHLYIRNYLREGHPGWRPLQAGPISEILQEKMATEEVAKKHFQLCFGHRPEEELYDIKTDPHQVHNLAGDPKLAEFNATLSKQLSEYMKSTDDPRAAGRGGIFAHYPLWCGGKDRMGGPNPAGKIEVFPAKGYDKWMNENFPKTEF